MRSTKAPLRSPKQSFYRVASCLVLALATLIPCLWQERIQAGDLASHVYNTWLVQLIRNGQAPGLWIAPIKSNLLFDVLLETLSTHFGFAAAQRIAVSCAVLFLIWGAFFFIARASASRPYFLFPCLWILIYGVLFHAGLFNLYLSMGLCLAYLGLVWEQGWTRHLSAALILAVAWVAHPFPVLWAVGIDTFATISFRLKPRSRIFLLVSALAALTAVAISIDRYYGHQYAHGQAFQFTGANVALVYGNKYKWIMAGLLVLWFTLLLRLIHQIGLASLAGSVLAQAWLLTVASVVLIPDTIWFPQYQDPFSFISVRLSFCAAIFLCAVIAQSKVKTSEKVFVGLLAAAYFTMLWGDERILNQRESAIVGAVETMPPRQRIVSSLPVPLNFIDHTLDRACIGRCFSYANYEPSSRQFRVRANPGNAIVMSSNSDVGAVGRGMYSVRSEDLPIITLRFCGPEQQICVQPLKAGELVGTPPPVVAPH